MEKTRALLTETERKQITGEHGDTRRYQAASRVRSRIEEELTTDVEILREHRPDLSAELREVVCEPEVTNTSSGGEGTTDSMQ
jgi:hypothetical protein